MAFDFLELLEKVDYNKYFEAMQGVPVSGAKAAEYSRFSKKATIAAAAKLDEFLRLMDREQLDAATSQVVAFQPPAEPVAEKTTVEEASSEPVVAEAGEAGGAPSFLGRVRAVREAFHFLCTKEGRSGCARAGDVVATLEPNRFVPAERAFRRGCARARLEVVLLRVGILVVLLDDFPALGDEHFAHGDDGGAFLRDPEFAQGLVVVELAAFVHASTTPKRRETARWARVYGRRVNGRGGRGRAVRVSVFRDGHSTRTVGAVTSRGGGSRAVAVFFASTLRSERASAGPGDARGDAARAEREAWARTRVPTARRNLRGGTRSFRVETR
jgi:hypothetical protein